MHAADHDLRYDVAAALGLLAWEKHETAASRLHYQEALAAAEEAADPVGQIRALGSLGMFDNDPAPLERAIEISEREFGPDHVLAARPLANLAAAYGYQGRYDEGFERARRGLEILRNGFGDAHPDLGYLLTLLAQLRTSQGWPEDAVVYVEEALPLVQGRLGPNASLVADVHHAYAQALYQAGRRDAALFHATEADRIYAVTRPPESLARRYLLSLEGSIQRDLGDLPAAVASHERLLSIARNSEVPEPTPGLLLDIGKTWIAAGRRDEARALLDLALKGVQENDPWMRAQVRFAMAQALWPDDPARARSLAEQAVAGLDTSPPLYRQFSETVHAWLKDSTL
jgi:tetratricopeptide (TPR) repeat protein